MHDQINSLKVQHSEFLRNLALAHEQIHFSFVMFSPLNFEIVTGCINQGILSRAEKCKQLYIAAPLQFEIGSDLSLRQGHPFCKLTKMEFHICMRKLSTAATTAILPKLPKMFFPIGIFHFVFFRILLYQKLTKMEFHICESCLQMPPQPFCPNCPLWAALAVKAAQCTYYFRIAKVAYQK